MIIVFMNSCNLTSIIINIWAVLFYFKVNLGNQIISEIVLYAFLIDKTFFYITIMPLSNLAKLTIIP